MDYLKAVTASGRKIGNRMEKRDHERKKRGITLFHIKRKVSYATLKKLKELPIFRGQFRRLVTRAENRKGAS